MATIENISQVWLFVLLVVIVIVLGASIALAYSAGKKRGQLELRADEQSRIERARKDAVERSRAVLSGQLSEQLAPYLPNFPTNPSDARL